MMVMVDSTIKYNHHGQGRSGNTDHLSVYGALIMVEVPEELKGQLQTAITALDWAAVAKISREIAKSQAAAEKTELEERQAALMDITTKVKKALGGVVKKMMEAAELDNEAIDGVFFAWDFGEAQGQPTCRLVKVAKRAGGGGGGAGKRFPNTTNELLEQYGSKQFKDGQTYAQAWEVATDGNSKYKVRKGLLHEAGLM